MTATKYRAEAGSAEWAIHLRFNNGHDSYCKHQSPDPASTLEEMQATAGAALRRLQAVPSFIAAEAHRWADLQHGSWQPIEHEDEGEVIYDATWVPTGRQYTGHCTEEGEVRWEQL